MGKNKKENESKYGEFVCSAYQWIPLDVQKKQAEKLSKITKKDKN